MHYLTFITYLLLSFLLSFTPFHITAAPIDKQVTPEQLTALEQRIASLQEAMQSTRTEYGQLQNSLQNSEETIGDVSQKLEQLRYQLNEQQKTLETLKKQTDKQKQQLAQQRKVLSQQIHAAYLAGRQDYLKLWLNQENPSSVGRVLTYYDYFNRARAQQIDIISQSLEHVTTLQLRTEKEKEQLNKLLQEELGKKQRLELSHTEREAILKALRKTLKNQNKELKRLQEDKKHFETLLGKLEQAAQSLPHPKGHKNFRQLKGKLPAPISAKITHHFGEKRIGHLRWQGVLFATKNGQEVRSIAAGRVVFAQWFRHFGLLVILDHGKGYMSLYGHNQSLYKKVGDWVEADTLLARSGESGGRDTPALYFEIRYQGKPINPLRWLQKK